MGPMCKRLMMKMPQQKQQYTLSALLLLFLAAVSCLAFQSPQLLVSSSSSCIGRRTSSRTSGTVCFLSTPQDDDETNSGDTSGISTEELPSSYVRCGRCEAVYALREEDLGKGKGRRLECSVCGHAWFQSKDRLMELRDGYQMVPLPESDRSRITMNIEQGKEPKFLGDVKLYVGNVAFECHEDDIFEVFSRVGDVGEVSLVRDDAGKNRGFGFVTMRTKEDGDKAIEALDGMSVRGRNIAVRASNN